MASTTQTLRTYRGNCHCGAFVYEADLPEIKSVYECNCSICHKKGYLWVFAGEDSRFRVVKGTDDTLTDYVFGSKTLLHKFCPTCATPVMGEFPNGPPDKKRALNVRAMQGVKTWELDKIAYDGAALGDAYVAPEFQDKTRLPAVPDGSKLYTGGCHCGAVGLALVSKPLDETFDDTTVECDCSICGRNGYRWVYPDAQRVVLAGDAARIGRYSFGRRLLCKTFCTVCGVCLTNEPQPLSEERRATLTDEERQWAAYTAARHPVNLRVLPGVHLARMKPPQRGNGTAIQPPYVEP